METTIREKLRVKLSEEELRAKAQEHARVHFAMDELEELKRSHMQQFGAQLKKLKTEAGKLAYDVSMGTEERELNCAERPDYRAFLVHIIRPDTGEVVRTRPMTAEERQTRWDNFMNGDARDDGIEDGEILPDNEH